MLLQRLSFQLSSCNSFTDHACPILDLQDFTNYETFKIWRQVLCQYIGWQLRYSSVFATGLQSHIKPHVSAIFIRKEWNVSLLLPLLVGGMIFSDGSCEYIRTVTEQNRIDLLLQADGVSFYIRVCYH